MLIEVEAKAIRVEKGSGNWTVTGVIDQEEVGGEGRKLIRKSMAREQWKMYLRFYALSMDLRFWIMTCT